MNFSEFVLKLYIYILYPGISRYHNSLQIKHGEKYGVDATLSFDPESNFLGHSLVQFLLLSKF